MDTCLAPSPDGTVKCDRPKNHYGNHDGPIRIAADTGLNHWTWPV